ncbi:phenylalanyl-tRNA synthetase beta subunit [Sporobacter termitidis DSM 10068]|uniref:Phenylalanine--tRNA ligase beta subunit n=1 Tax=Sporobacter termitidis DSM 10068 TaxID=1123282 RepID=A0A1M5WE51_9FIRM|nr:phenylalanine--tRNA ligase subunit beta [Sporobacter termitidis]SHH85740.1 phenylalanyl-tRNA synthetase beta subunit [Sporobacter termitidis DSM 10068]
MDLSRKWLSAYTDITAFSKEYADKMTMSGSKVELIREPSEEIKNVLVGQVKEIYRHPDSDHMWVCQVDVGQAEPIQIVTGAQNVRAGDLVPVAMHKSFLPGGKKIEKGKLRGLVSNGMLCSLGELGLDKHDFPYAEEDGIFILQEDCKPGDDIRPVIGADDSIVEFEITNNRPDCLSVIGLARESAVTFGTELHIPEPKVRGGSGDIAEQLAIEIENPDLCPRYTARMIKNIRIEPSPKWLRQRLRAAGVRPINNIVDITNYVMLEYGQPMHAFDYACLDGGRIVVRTARPGETIHTLDGTPRALTADMLVIADAKKPVGVAGVMGGENSEITENTKYAVFESASFNGISIRKTAMALNMRTDASSRFEKGLDPENTFRAVQRACELVEELGAGEVLDGVVDITAKQYLPRTLQLEPEKICRLLGAEIPAGFMIETLQKLGFTVSGETVTVPSWRGDVEHYSDLAEEVARFYGYNVIAPAMFGGETVAGGLTEKQALERHVGQVLRGMGFSEIYTYSFISPAAYDKIKLNSDSILRKSTVILNPLGEDTSVMRTTALPSMLETLARNMNYRNQNVRLYEMAKVYRPSGETLPDERLILTLGAYGKTDFFAVKGCVEALLCDLRIPDVRFEADRGNPSYHPGRCAAVYSGKTVIGVIGQIHPAVDKTYDLGETYTAELDFTTLLTCRAAEGKYAPLPRFPAVERDIALVCDAAVTVGALEDCIKRGGGALLREVELFDIYTGSQVPQGKKSVAFALKLRADDMTLTDEHADEATKKILALLEKETGAVIR